MRLLSAAEPGDLINTTTAGRLACKIGLSITDEAGRKMVSRLVKSDLLALGPTGFVQGGNCVT